MAFSTGAAAAFRLTVAALAAIAAGACTSLNYQSNQLEGTNWRVAAVNGRPTPGVGDYSLRFERGSIGARFGCNSMGGRYLLAGQTLTVSELASTLMGCSEPAATFESQGGAVMTRPMRVEFTSGTSLTLSNAAGAITLERAKGSS